MSEASVHILMGTRNGARHVTRQMASFLDQDHTNWALVASDDGSTDETRDHLRDFQMANPRFEITLRDGPKQGFAVNFLDLVGRYADASDAVALSDQDDVWLTGKLRSALGCVCNSVDSQPRLYLGRTLIVDKTLVPTGLSPLFKHRPCFRNALVQSIGGGNTMVMNRAAATLVAAAGVRDVVSHDWWIYQLVTGAGGQVIYDAEPFLLYRQHETNTLGSNRGAQAAFARVRGVADGRYKDWIDRNTDALFEVRHLLTPQALATLEAFAHARNQVIWQRPRELVRAGIHRQGTLGQASLLMASCFGKV